MDQSPWDAVTRSFGMTEIVAPKTLIEILTGSHIAAAGLAATQNVNVKHGDKRSNPLGPAGFEPTTCRRGDRTTIGIDQVRRDLDLTCSSALFSKPRCDYKIFHCGSKSMEFRDAYLWNDRDCGAEDAHRDPHRIPHSGGRSCCCAERKRETRRGISYIGPAGFEPTTS